MLLAILLTYYFGYTDVWALPMLKAGIPTKVAIVASTLQPP